MTASKRTPCPQAEIVVNGKRVPAKPFVQEILGEAILAIVRKLKRVDADIRTVEVKVTRDA